MLCTLPALHTANIVMAILTVVGKSESVNTDREAKEELYSNEAEKMRNNK